MNEEEEKPRPRGVWQKGVSGNPYGRPKNAQSQTVLLREIADRNPGKAAARLHYYATDPKFGDAKPELQIRALEIYFDRLDGKPAVTIERSPDERHLAWAELQTKLLERWQLKQPDAAQVVDAEFRPALPEAPAFDRPGRGRPKGSRDKTPRTRRSF